MSEKKIKPTMKDVAREAGVAIGTVSKVLNGLPAGEEYKIKVEEAVEKLNYRVNSYAKGLRENKTFTVAVMVPNLVSPFFSKLVNCILKSLTARKYRMMLYATDDNAALEQEFIYLAEQVKVDGIICLTYSFDLEISEDIPFVSIDRFFGAKAPCIASDNYGGGVLAVEKLVENGCKNLAFMRIGSKLMNEPDKRKDGFISACERLGVDYTLKTVDDGTPYSAFEDFLHEHCRDGKLDFDGIFCVTDVLAYQICGSLKGMGISVPEDVQIIGFDGIRSFGNLDLFCSTIVQPVEEIAETSVELLLNKPKSGSLICLPVSYAYGGTTKS